MEASLQWKAGRGRTAAETIFLTSSLPSSSRCRAGRGWSAAALWLRAGELGGQTGTWRWPRTTVPVGRRVRRPRDFVLAYKCGAIATAKRQNEQKNTSDIVSELCVADVLHKNVQPFCCTAKWHKIYFFIFYWLYFHTLLGVLQAGCRQTEKAKLGYFPAT